MYFINDISMVIILFRRLFWIAVYIGCITRGRYGQINNIRGELILIYVTIYRLSFLVAEAPHTDATSEAVSLLLESFLIFNILFRTWLNLFLTSPRL